MIDEAPDPDAVKALFALLQEADASDAGPEDVARAVEARALAAPPVRAAAEALRAAHRRAAGMLLDGTGPPGAPDADEAPEADDGPPPEIDGYAIGECIGRGGFGIVFRARQLEPVERDVAVKVLRTELATPSLRARFRAEARLLARMNHPGIARVLDAGVDASRRPFLAMELVDGLPLVRYCEHHALSVRDRVRLVADVCDAVHHAHQRAVIHRDLKPANVLVERVDGRARPRVIDFGIARLLEHDDDDSRDGERTQRGTRLGTPRYMSPEQAQGESPVDLRTDVYALGVLLCEVLTGQVPRAPLVAGRRGGSVTTAATRPSALAARGGPDLLHRSRELRGDLDRIVLMAVALEPDQRYASAAALADDLRRYLDGRPVLATPPRPLYLFGRFILRHRVASAAIAVAVCSLIAGTVAAVIGLTRATESRRDAETALLEAEHERDRVRAMADFLLGDLIEALDPDHAGDPDRSLSDRLRLVAADAERRLADDPRVLAEVMHRLGMAMQTLTDFAAAADTLDRAAALSVMTRGATDRITLHRRMDALLAAMSARRLDGIADRITGIHDDARRVHGDEDPVTWRAALHRAHVIDDDAAAVMRRIVDRFAQAGAEQAPYDLEAMRYLASTLRHAGDPGASDLFRRAASLASERLGPLNSRTIELRLEAARSAMESGQVTDAEALFREIESMTVTRFGPDNWYRNVALSALMRIAYGQGRYAEAMAHAERRLALLERRQGPDSEACCMVRVDMGTIALAAGDRPRAEASLVRAVACLAARVDETDERLRTARRTLAELLGPAGADDAPAADGPAVPPSLP
ncbi:MAG: serine/threonine protein kinase [Phycisphaeraceae bacterium]|nr:serine/threonine protein kinase [Phycisphaeraceae bacterium]